MRTFVGGVGARESRDHSIGALVSERLAHDAPIEAAQVVVEQLSANPVQVAERLSAEWPPFERVIFVGAVARSRPAGTVQAYRWDGEVVPHDEDDDSSSGGREASLENTLLVARELGGLPDEIIVVEVEPEVAAGFGPELSAATTAAIERARTLVRRLATNARAVADLPRSALGGMRPSRDEIAD
jgi:hydrogenase maturation protease